ncbi:MAG: hypothetical protein M3Y77_03220 [Actinomycetota bacterium]|nr:hypothetical protein [Actinomycetota bacterium]
MPRGQVPVHRSPAHTEGVGDGLRRVLARVVHLSGHAHLVVAHHAPAPAGAPTSPRRSQTSVRALDDELVLNSARAPMTWNNSRPPAAGGRGVDGLGERAERDAALPELPDDLE